MLNEQALEPCPFCGGPARLTYSDRGEVHQVRCNNWTGDAGSKSCMGGGAYAYTEEGAIAAWNRRTALPLEGAGEPVAEDRVLKDRCRMLMTKIYNRGHSGLDQGCVLCQAYIAVDRLLAFETGGAPSVEVLSWDRRTASPVAAEPRGETGVTDEAWEPVGGYPWKNVPKDVKLIVSYKEGQFGHLFLHTRVAYMGGHDLDWTSAEDGEPITQPTHWRPYHG